MRRLRKWPPSGTSACLTVHFRTNSAIVGTLTHTGRRSGPLRDFLKQEHPLNFLNEARSDQAAITLLASPGDSAAVLERANIFYALAPTIDGLQVQWDSWLAKQRAISSAGGIKQV